MNWDSLNYREQRAVHIFAHALDWLIYNHTPEARVRKLWGDDQHPDYIAEWVERQKSSPLCNMSEDTVLRFIRMVLETYGDEATQLADLYLPVPVPPVNPIEGDPDV